MRTGRLARSDFKLRHYRTLTFLDSKKPEARASGEERPAAREPAMAGAGGSTGAGFGSGDLDADIPFAACWQ